MYRRKLKSPEPDQTKPENNKTKIIIAASLCLLLLMLMTIYFFSGSDKGSSENLLHSALQPAKMESDIDSILSVFGIESSWRKDIKKNVKESGIEKNNLWIAKDILIPEDLMTIEINYELSEYFRKNMLIGNAAEDPKTKNLKILISKSDTSGSKIGILNFIYSDTLKRKAPDICIILDSIDFLSADEAGIILNTSENVSAILPLRNDKADFQSIIMESGKNFLIELTIGDENNITADIKSDMKSLTWKSKIKSVSLNFPDASGIIIKNQLDDAEFVKNVRQEFESYKFKVYSDSIYKLSVSGENKIKDLFGEILKHSKNGLKKLLFKIKFSPAEFNEYKTEVYKFKKAGYKFLSFREFTGKTDASAADSITNKK